MGEICPGSQHAIVMSDRDVLVSDLWTWCCGENSRAASRSTNSIARLFQRPIEERPDLLPAVGGLLLSVGRAVVVEEPVARPVVAMELVLLAVLLELRLVLVHLLRRRGLVVVAEQPEERGGEVLGVVDGGHRLLRRQLVLRNHHAAAPAVDDRVEVLQTAAGEERL